MPLKFKKTLFTMLLVLCGFIILWQYQSIGELKQQINLYQEKNDLTFHYLLKDVPSLVPLVNILNQLSEVKINDESAFWNMKPNAEKMSHDWQQRLLQLIHHSDINSEQLSKKYSINEADFIMTSKEQEELGLIAFQSDIGKVLYSIGYEYKESKSFDETPRKIIQNIADQLFLLDKTILEYQELTGWHESNQNFKVRFLTNVKPHLEKIQVEVNNYQDYIKSKYEK